MSVVADLCSPILAFSVLRFAISFPKERLGVVDHLSEHAADLPALGDQLIVLLRRDIPAFMSEIERRIRFAVLTVAIGELADEMRIVHSLGQASRRLRQIDRDDLLIWLVNANLSSAGKSLLIRKMSMARP